MDIKKQVCSLEQATKLRQLGILQNRSHFVFVAEKENGPWELVAGDGYEWSDYPCYAGWPFSINTYTVAELGVMLWDLVGLFCFDLGSGGWLPSHGLQDCQTEAEARASLLIHFLESDDDYINAKVCNERLSQ